MHLDNKWRHITKCSAAIISCIVAVILVSAIGGIIKYKTSIDKQSVNTEIRPVNGPVKYLNHSNPSNLGQIDLIKSKRRPKLKSARAALAINASTGHIIYDKNMNQNLKVASLAKLMTLYLTEQKANQDHAWNDVVLSANNMQLRRMSYDRNGLGGFKFKKDHHYTVNELFKAALIESSNNAAIALGEWVGKNNTHFIHLMNSQARIWHLHARFISASGLENDDIDKYHLHVSGGKQSGNEISAKDLGIIADHLINKYPETLSVSKQSSAKVDGQTLNNLNRMLPGQTYAKSNLHVDGLKTGFTHEAGYCFVGTEKAKNKPRIITVVLHDNQDFPDTAKLMSWINSNLH